MTYQFTIRFRPKSKKMSKFVTHYYGNRRRRLIASATSFESVVNIVRESFSRKDFEYLAIQRGGNCRTLFGMQRKGAT